MDKNQVIRRSPPDSWTSVTQIVARFPMGIKIARLWSQITGELPDTNGTTSTFWQVYETLQRNILEYNARETQTGIRAVCCHTYQGTPKHLIGTMLSPAEFNKAQKPFGIKGSTTSSVKIIAETGACGTFRRFAQSQLLC
uniref:Uncharacterized protein n=1 Tax=Vespula pensylvanica TaxID=30213 RepID=A0A834P2N7_VESPE|nr:hypothetical protein H0235_008010 [Vespula pensylvanica]